MEISIKKLGNYAKVTAPKGMYALKLDTNEIVKNTIVLWDDDTDKIKAMFKVITPEEKAEIDLQNESEEDYTEE